MRSAATGPALEDFAKPHDVSRAIARECVEAIFLLTEHGLTISDRTVLHTKGTRCSQDVFEKAVLCKPVQIDPSKEPG